MKRSVFGFFAIALLSFIVGCQQDNSGTTGPGGGTGTGTLSVRLTDAPAAYDSVVIAVDSVRVHIDITDTTGGWYTVSRTPATYDLLQFTGGKDTLIAEGPVPAGYYSQLRLYIGEGSHVVVDGLPIPLFIPSGTQSGLKLNIQTTIVGGVKYVLLLDFDAAHSIVVTGNGRYMLKPVIKVVTTAASGSLSGVVSPAATTPTVWAIAGTDTSGTMSDGTGYFKFAYLAPATYSVTIVPADTTYRDTTLTNVSVSAGYNTNLGTIALQKK
jgi:hypothetical protein